MVREGYSVALRGHHWFALVIFISIITSTPVLMDSENEELGSSTKPTAHEIRKILRILSDNMMTGPTDDNMYDDLDPSTSAPRTRKSGTARPKYDPGLKWMGLGKRATAGVPIGPELFTDLRRFFKAAHTGMLRRRENSLEDLEHRRFLSGGRDELQRNVGVAMPVHQLQQDVQQLKFVTRSKGGGDTNGQPRQHYNYNPSLLWTGLGR